MAVTDKDTLKSYFKNGDEPTEAQFGDLIDTLSISGGGITIPQPQIHIKGSGLAYPHTRGAKIGENTILIVENDNQLKETIEGISLYVTGTDSAFRNHDPHYFLFRLSNKGTHRGQKKYNKERGQRTNKNFVHPAHGNGAMFTNFGGGNHNKFGISEMPLLADNHLTNVPLNSSILYKIKYNSDVARFHNFFPRTLTEWNRDIILRFNNSGKNNEHKNIAKKLVLAFAVVIRNPSDNSKYIIGPMSKMLIIEPKLGVFNLPIAYYNETSDLLSIPESPDYLNGDMIEARIFFGWRATLK